MGQRNYHRGTNTVSYPLIVLLVGMLSYSGCRQKVTAMKVPVMPIGSDWFTEHTELRLDVSFNPAEGRATRDRAQVIVFVRLNDGSTVIPFFHIKQPRYRYPDSWDDNMVDTIHPPLVGWNNSKISRSPFFLPRGDHIDSYIFFVKMLEPEDEWRMKELSATDVVAGNGVIDLGDVAQFPKVPSTSEYEKLWTQAEAAQKAFSTLQKEANRMNP